MSGWIAVDIVVAGVALWLFSHFLELLRPRPKTPTALRWSAGIPIKYIEIGGVKLRYIKAGAGPTVVLLHTLRTQLDLFEAIIPELSKHCTVYALDYPGHGYSDIPRARYDAPFFVAAVEGFLDAHDLRDVTLAGVSIGGVIPLVMAARRSARVARVVSINPYDYAKGRGLARSSLFGWLDRQGRAGATAGRNLDAPAIIPGDAIHLIRRGGATRQHLSCPDARDARGRKPAAALPCVPRTAAERQKLGIGA